jgi:hypothetical protein
VLYEQARRHAGRAACPSVVIMDGQSVKTTERGGARGFDARKPLLPKASLRLVRIVHRNSRRHCRHNSRSTDNHTRSMGNHTQRDLQ